MTFRSCYLAMSAAAAVACAAGCTQAPPPEFHLNLVQAAVNDVSVPYQQEIANVLEALLGTPDNPQVMPDMGLDQGMLMLAAGPAWTDENSMTHGLYRRHCVHCHGISGDGQGPTARFLNPYPRDYRKGLFKFKSTYAAAKPTDEDLTRILHNGIPGTSMPSFSLLPPPEVEALVAYVKYLSIRGEMETALVNYVTQELGEEDLEDENGDPVLDENGAPKTYRIPLDPAVANKEAESLEAEAKKITDAAANGSDEAKERAKDRAGDLLDRAEELRSRTESIQEMLADVLSRWEEAADNVIVPEQDQAPDDNRAAADLAESIEAGRKLFFGKTANCFSCHGPTALGDGQQTDFDDWTKDLVNLENLIEGTKKSLERLETAPADETDEQEAEREAKIAANEALLARMEAALAINLPKRNAIPRNLRQGIFRGGRRRMDIFVRVHAGIPGVPMPGVGSTAPGGEGTLTEEQIWQIVDYIISLPYEPASGPHQDLPTNQAAVAR